MTGLLDQHNIEDLDEEKVDDMAANRKQEIEHVHGTQQTASKSLSFFGCSYKNST